MANIEVAQNNSNNTLQKLDTLNNSIRNNSPINKAIQLTDIYHGEITLPKLGDLYQSDEEHIKLLWPLQNEVFGQNNITIEQYENNHKLAA